ncbi:glycosyltransferase family 4 protein [Flavobacterium sp. GT3R68]|uniref:glycosyltransferase family 4 protein n=1 Tax=Flavobacterium sp. GT3R68 TaxID=2594437 RepID=UPI000F86EC72|nr:glycosyltransferase [Flavobacterium sp. GT3R68]RTY92275.1 glycosyltransferase [Flavobacterium sp. GSN2]TRW92511.1 glycosyltransferase [Flavobacterium sp. GT3R68]
MHSKPELIVISQNLMGGGSSFHRNMLAHRPDEYFDVKCIYLDPLDWAAKRLENHSLGENDSIFEFTQQPDEQLAEKLNKHISNKKGAIVANLPEELITLDHFPKSNKTVYFICHDKGFLYLVKKYEYLIDIFIAHNFEVYESIRELLPKRLKDVHFIQHGVEIQNYKREKKESQKLNLVFLARHVKSKGIYDLPKINQILVNNNIEVNWMILGDGEEKQNFKKEVSAYSNFQFETPETNADVIEILKRQDIYILPSSLDGLPVSLLESMSVGCVPIVYNFSEGIKKVITNDIGYVENIGDINSVAEKIILLHNDRNRLFEQSTNAINKVEKEFNIKIQANEYFNLYKKFKSLKKNRFILLTKLEKKYSKYKIVRIGFKVLRILKMIQK